MLKKKATNSWVVIKGVTMDVKKLHYCKSWFLKRFKLTNLSFFMNGHVHLIKGQGFE